MIKESVAVKELQQTHLEIEKLNNYIFDLKELKEYGNVLDKLIEIRAKNRATTLSDTHLSSGQKLAELNELVTSRQNKYQAKRKSLKGKKKDLS